MKVFKFLRRKKLGRKKVQEKMRKKKLKRKAKGLKQMEKKRHTLIEIEAQVRTANMKYLREE